MWSGGRGGCCRVSAIVGWWWWWDVGDVGLLNYGAEAGGGDGELSPPYPRSHEPQAGSAAMDPLRQITSPHSWPYKPWINPVAHFASPQNQPEVAPRGVEPGVVTSVVGGGGGTPRGKGDVSG